MIGNHLNVQIETDKGVLETGKSVITGEMGKNEDKDVMVKNEEKGENGHIANK